MQVEAIPLTDFVHGRINAREGHPVMLDEHVAADLERAHLVRIRTAHAIPTNKVESGKAADDGRGQPSSVLPAAPVSPMKTSRSSKAGEIKTRNRDA